MLFNIMLKLNYFYAFIFSICLASGACIDSASEFLKDRGWGESKHANPDDQVNSLPPIFKEFHNWAELEYSVINGEKILNKIFQFASENEIVSNDCVRGGCASRAHIIAKSIEDEFGVKMVKAFALGKNMEYFYREENGLKKVKWGNHVANAVLVDMVDRHEIFIIDPSIADGPLLVKQWINKFGGQNTASIDEPFNVNLYYENRFRYKGGYFSSESHDMSITKWDESELERAEIDGQFWNNYESKD